MLVCDLKKDYDKFEKLWIDCMSFIEKECRSDKLYENYLNIDLGRFLSLAIVIENDKIIAFGGAEVNQSRWGDNVSRVLSRFWISPTHRHQIVSINSSKNYSPLILDINLKSLRNHEKIKLAMITLQDDGKNSFKRIIDIANTVTENKFQILEGKFNVCGILNPVPESCKQMIGISQLDYSVDKNEILADLFSKGLLKKC